MIEIQPYCRYFFQSLFELSVSFYISLFHLFEVSSFQLFLRCFSSYLKKVFQTFNGICCIVSRYSYLFFFQCDCWSSEEGWCVLFHRRRARPRSLLGSKTRRQHKWFALLPTWLCGRGICFDNIFTISNFHNIRFFSFFNVRVFFEQQNHFINVSVSVFPIEILLVISWWTFNYYCLNRIFERFKFHKLISRDISY